MLEMLRYYNVHMTLIIAEIAQAHDGSEGMLESLVRSSLKAGADAIKLQLHYAEHESTYDETFRIQLSNKYPKRFFSMFHTPFTRRHYKVARLLFRAYIAWSICADFIILGGVIYLLFR